MGWGLDFDPLGEQDGLTLQACDTLPEGRLRILSMLKRSYWAFFQSGLLSPDGLRYLPKPPLRSNSGSWVA